MFNQTMLNPTGNVFERITACWFLFFHPREFINGVISEFVVQAERSIAYQATQRESEDAAARDLNRAVEASPVRNG